MHVQKVCQSYTHLILALGIVMKAYSMVFYYFTKPLAYTTSACLLLAFPLNSLVYPPEVRGTGGILVSVDQQSP